MPSVAMIPFFEEFASDYPDFLFLSVDVDEVKVISFSYLFSILVNAHFGSCIYMRLLLTITYLNTSSLIHTICQLSV